MEDKAFWKIRLSMLWLIYECGAITSSIMELYLPGFAEGLIAGELETIKITPELILTLTIFLLIPPVMAFLSVTFWCPVHLPPRRPAGQESHEAHKDKPHPQRQHVHHELGCTRRQKGQQHP